MNCEHVRELLSAYLDDALASKDHRAVAAHLESCSDCSAILADYRRFDALLAHLPRVRPGPSIHSTLFSSPEYLELTGTTGRGTNEETLPLPARRADDTTRPHLISLPGGRLRSSEKPTVSMPVPSPIRRRRRFSTQHLMYVAIAATLLLTFSISGLIGWRLWQQPESALHPLSTFTPPAAPQGSQAPIPAGIRFVFLRNGALWSAPTDGSRTIAHLTPEQVSVAEHWTVRDPLPGRPAGNLLAYIDQLQGYIHIIRSDGQNDTTIQQPLLRANADLAQIWKTETGAAILNSLNWSPDGSKLAFVADPDGTNTPGLYIYTVKVGTIEKASLPAQGAISHPIWSPDNTHIAFLSTRNGKTDLLDYHVSNHSINTIVTADQLQANTTGNSLLTFAWSPSTEKLTLTWSVGTKGHIQSIWQKDIQATVPHALIEGEFTEALYNHAGNGRWLVANGRSNQPGDITTIDFQGNKQQLTSNKRTSFAQWSPDGKYIAYFDAVTNNRGQLHLLDVTTGIDMLVASEAATQPSPVWSPNSQQIAYSTGNQVLVVDVQNSKSSQPLKPLGSAIVLTWSAHTPNQLVLVMGDAQPGIYLIDTLHDTALLLDSTAITGPVLWTQIP